jgi:glycosyltransferase involved in cell wall biosynthesis
LRPGSFPSIFYYWVDIDRQNRLRPERIYDYPLDDLKQFHNGINRAERWNAYLNFVLPYYYDFRHVLPDGLPERTQSLPPNTRHILCTKSNHYDTTTDVGIRNFDVFAQGERFFKLNYLYSGQMETNKIVTDDALLLLRIIDDGTFNFATKGARNGLPVGYALDDDLLNISQDGGEFSYFRAGDPFYDVMIDTIKWADVVLCGGAHVQKSVQHLNRRTVHFEGSVLPEFLPQNTSRKNKIPFKFGYAGGRYRVDEMHMLWPAIERICQEYADRVRFEFWGLDPDKLPSKLKQVSFKPFSISYYEYLSRLMAAGFGAMLIPLSQRPGHRQGKLPNKLYETAVAGAVGLYSDVPTYDIVKRNRLGLIVEENTEAWYEAMRSILDMPEREYEELYSRSQAFVGEFYSTPSMLPVHEHGLEAILFHGSTRSARCSDGRPRVIYVFHELTKSWGEVAQFSRFLELGIKSAISPFVIMNDKVKDFPAWESLSKFLEAHCIPYESALYHPLSGTLAGEGMLASTDGEVSVRHILSRQPAALVHSIGYNPVFGKVCTELGIPHIVSLSGMSDSYYRPKEEFPSQTCTLIQSDSIHSSRNFGEFFDRPWFCSRGIVPESLYEIGFERLYGEASRLNANQQIQVGIMVSLIPEKFQLVIIQSLSKAIQAGHKVHLNIFGETEHFLEHHERFQKLMNRLSLQDCISFKDAVQDPSKIYPPLDILISVSTSSSLPNDAKEAMASGILTVVVQINGGTELLMDGVNAILLAGFEPEKMTEALMRAINLSANDSLCLRRNAYRMARQEFHPRRGLADLLSMYNLALQIHANAAAGAPISQIKTVPVDKQIAYTPTATSPSSHIPIVRRLTYHVVPLNSNWMGLDVLVGTHQAQTSGILSLRVISDAGHLLREVFRDLSDTCDNSWLEIRFNPITNSLGKKFILEFKLANEAIQTRISLFESNPPEARPRRLLRRIGVLTSGNSLYCRMHYAKKD